MVTRSTLWFKPFPNDSPSHFQHFTQPGLSGLLFVICLLKLKKLEKTLLQNPAQAQDLLDLRDSIDDLNQEGLKIALEIGEKLDEYRELQRMGAGPVSNAHPSPVNDVKRQPDKYAEVIRLASEGMKPLTISKKLNMPIGEVELAMTLRQ